VEHVNGFLRRRQWLEGRDNNCLEENHWIRWGKPEGGEWGDGGGGSAVRGKRKAGEATTVLGDAKTPEKKGAHLR